MERWGWGDEVEGSWPGFQGQHLPYGHQTFNLLPCQMGMTREYKEEGRELNNQNTYHVALITCEAVLKCFL